MEIILLPTVKMALRITTDAFDSQLLMLIQAAEADMAIAGVKVSNPEVMPAVVQAICTYCLMNFGEPENYDRLKRSYDEQKAQLSTSSKYNGRSEA